MNKLKSLLLSSFLILSMFLIIYQSNTVKMMSTDSIKVHNPILFLHGWTKSSLDWNKMIDWFTADGWPVTALYAYNFSDTNDNSEQAYINKANQVKQWVDDILTETGCKKIDLIGHSMGGSNGRYYIKFLGGIDKVDDYVSLASDHHGCWRWPNDGINYMLELFNEGDETSGGILNDTLGERENPFPAPPDGREIIYNSTHIPGTINYVSIYSKDDEFIPWQSCVLDGAYNIEVPGVGHSQIYQDETVYELVKGAVDDLHELTIPSFIFPTGGEILSGSINISWTTSYDTWCYCVKYNLSYSNDEGLTWTLLKGNIIETNFLWETHTIPDGSNYILQIVTFSDGGLNNSCISSPFLISNPSTTTTAPLTTITTTTTPSTTTRTAIGSPGFEIFLLLISLNILILIQRVTKIGKN